MGSIMASPKPGLSLADVVSATLAGPTLAHPDTAALVRSAFIGSKEADGAAPRGLDACNGHVGVIADGTETYHSHASEAFPNLPSCLVGVQAEANFTTTATAAIGAQRPGEGGRNEAPPPAGGGPGGMPPGFDAAAATLGVTPEALLQAMDAAGGRDADFAVVAEALGVEAAPRAALPAAPDWWISLLRSTNIPGRP